MNSLRGLLLITIFLITPSYSAGEPLLVGVENYTPPFVMQGANNAVYGYDIDMMNTLCGIINRTCQFRIMQFEQLIPAVINKQIDVAASSMTITSDRAAQVNFTIPYLISYSRFLTNSATPLKRPFSLQELNGKKIGIEEGTIFNDQIQQMGITNPIIKLYPSIEASLEALSEQEIDFALLDSPTALYWEANSSGTFKTAGQPYQYGFGLGIAVNKEETDLLQLLNKALLQYQNSNAYKANYNRYLQQF